MNGSERESYDAALDAGNERGTCPVCDGGDGEPCSEECDRIVARVNARRLVKGLTEQAQHCLKMAKAYRAEEGPGGVRERACLDVVAGCRIRIRLNRALIRLHEAEAS